MLLNGDRNWDSFVSRILFADDEKYGIYEKRRIFKTENKHLQKTLYTSILTEN